MDLLIDLETDDYFANIPIKSNNKNFLTLIIYDISDTKRRNKLIKLIESYGYRVQKSVFEALLTNKKYDKLITEISILAHKDDLIKVYQLKGDSRTFSWGDMKELEDRDVIFI